MNLVQKDFLALLRCALWRGEPVKVKADLHAIIELAGRQKTRVLLNHALRRSGIEPEQADAAQMKLFLHRTLSAHVILNQRTEAVVRMLDTAGVPSVLLKGQGLSLLYPDSFMRECGDIDLYVGEEQYAKACRLVMDFSMDAEKRGHEVETDKHLHVRRGYLVVEVHRFCLTLPDRQQNDFFQQLARKGLWENLVPLRFGQVTVQTPAPDFNALYVFLHAWQHFLGGGVGLRQFCDWTLLLHSLAGKLDTDYLRQALDALNLWRPWQVFGAIAVDHLGLPAEEMPFYNPKESWRGRSVLSMILREGSFGQYRPSRSRRPRNVMLRKAWTLWALLLRSCRLFPVFPAQALSSLRRGIRGGLEKLSKS